MSVELMAVCWKKSFDNHADKDVMVALCDHANDDGVCWPSRSYIAWKVDRHPDTVKESLKKFRKLGIIETRREANNDLAKSPVVRVDPRKLPDKPAYGDRGASDPPGGGVSDPPDRGASDPPKPPGEPSVESSRRDADASPDIEKDTFGFFCSLANTLDVEILPEDRDRGMAKHFKDLKRTHEPTREELKRVVSKVLEARANGYEMSPQKALSKVRGNNVVPMRPEPTRPRKRVI